MKRSPILRKSELRSKARKDKVTPGTAEYVASRDGRCVMAILEPTHQCHDRYGNRIASDGVYELDHVDNGGTGKRGPSTPSNLVRLCPYGHLTKTHFARLWRGKLHAYLVSIGERAA